MASDLRTKFTLIDEMSDKLEKMAEAGEQMLESWEDGAESVDDALNRIDSSSNDAVSSVDSIAESLDSYKSSAESAADSTDYWTDAVGNYDKGCLEAIYSTEELVEMGFKTEAALEAEAQAAQTAEDSLENLEDQINDTSDSMEDMGENSTNSVELLSDAIIASGIADKLEEITAAAFEMAEEFSEAESIIVKATGATGDALDSLTQSTMKAYAASKTGDLEATASAVGEINTRLGYTGEKLETATDMFLNFAEVTGGDVTSSVRNVTQLMNQWNVEESQMESLMNKLTYAGQATGISVDNLSSDLINNKSVLDQLGFSLEESIAMFGNFEISGTNASAVMTGFRTALTNGTISSLEDLYDVFDRIADGTMSTTEACDLFGKRAGPQIVNAVKSGTLELENMVDALNNTDNVLEKTAETSQTMGQKWEQATNKVGAAFQSALSPALEKFSNGMSDVVSGIGDFLNDNPAVTKAITAIGIGLGVVTAAIVAVGVAVKVVKPLIISTMTEVNAALGPIGWIAIAIGGVVTAIAALSAMMEDNVDETYEMTAATRENYYAVQEAQEKYEEACAAYGETSEEASELRSELNDLTEEFDNNRKTVEEFVAEVEAVDSAHQDLMKSLDESSASANNNALDILALSEKLEALATSSTNTVTSEELMKTVFNELDEACGGLNMTYEEFINNLDTSVESVKQLAQAQAEKERQQEKYDAYVQLLKDQAEVQDKLTEATKEQTAAQEEYDAAVEAYSKWMDECADKHISNPEQLINLETGKTYVEEYTTAIGAASHSLDAANEAVDTLNADLAETNGELSSLEGQFEDAIKAEEEAAKATEEENRQLEQAKQNVSDMESAYNAVTSVLGEYGDEIQTVAEKYTTLYDSCLSSMQGQFGLFDQASMESEAYLNSTVANAQAAMNTQLEYWQNYSANINVLKDVSADQLGLTQENYDLLMEQVQGGSEEAAGLAQSMVDAYNSGNTQVLTDLGNTIGEVNSLQESTAATTAEWATNFSTNLDGVVDKMNTAITEMDLTPEAETAAKNTLNGYIAEVKAGGETAIQDADSVAQRTVNSLFESASSSGQQVMATYLSGLQSEGNAAIAYAQQVASQVAATLASANSQSASTTPGHANGTTFGEDMYWAGEEGPELVHLAHAYAKGTTEAQGEYYIAGEHGPELIVGQEGSEVFPTSETDRLIAALNNKEDYRYSADEEPEATPALQNSSIQASSKQVVENIESKRITLEIAGTGAINVGDGVSKQSILETLQTNLKPILMSIIQQEIYEEGQYSYEY